jgi:hypothetical protein
MVGRLSFRRNGMVQRSLWGGRGKATVGHTSSVQPWTVVGMQLDRDRGLCGRTRHDEAFREGLAQNPVRTFEGGQRRKGLRSERPPNKAP